MTDASTNANLHDFLGEPQGRKLPRWAKWGGIAIGIILLLLLARAFFDSTPATGYATIAAKRGDMQVHVTATGNLAPTNEVSVGSELSGVIDTVMVEENDRVVKGQALAQINTERLIDTIHRSEAALASARANVVQMQSTVTQTQATLARQEEVSRISGGKVPSKTEMDGSRADYQRAVANLAVARANADSAAAQLSTDQTNLSRTTIRSPVTGVILSRQIEPGQTVAASFNTPTLFLIAEDLSRMELEVKVDEADVGQVKEGQTATFTVDAWPGKTFPATIKRVNVGSNNASTTTTTTASTSSVVSYGAVLTVANEALILRPGMTATATITTSEEKNVLLVPNAALRYQPRNANAVAKPSGSLMPFPMGGRRGASTQEVAIGRGSRQTVYTLGDDGKLTPHVATAGSTNGSETIVTSETLKPGMKVVTGELAAGK
jgi:HlyD family secretion protein